MQLNCIEAFDVQKLGHDSAELLHLVSECIKVVKADVYRYTADPSTNEMPVAGMLSKDYAARRRELIRTDAVMAFPEAGLPPGVSEEVATARVFVARFPERIDPAGHTDSFSIVDAEGNAVACTPTHGSSFGTSVVVGNTGLTFNNGTRIGSTAPYPDHVNYARGGRIPLLNNSPIIVVKDGRFVLAIGTPGGETIRADAVSSSAQRAGFRHADSTGRRRAAHRPRRRPEFLQARFGDHPERRRQNPRTSNSQAGGDGPPRRTRRWLRIRQYAGDSGRPGKRDSSRGSRPAAGRLCRGLVEAERIAA